MNELPRVRVTGGPYAGHVGHRICRASDVVFVRLHTRKGIDLVEVPERQIEVFS